MQHDSIPRGLCQCGCGQKTRIATQTHRGEGKTKGESVRYLKGHNRREGPVDYVVDEETGCWIWQRHCQKNGYGRAWDGQRLGIAHRIYYERLVGPIPDGLHLDHLCRNRACVNPAHLEPVTVTENNRRSFRGRSAAGQFLPGS